MKSPIELTAEQNEAVELFKKCQVSILTGGPGTGKTTTIKEVIREAQSLKMDIACCAPSGKAAKRMHEATGYPSSTIHRLLKAYMTNDGKFRFQYNKKNRLNYDLIVVDETSMVSNDLMARLLEAVINPTKLLFVGDPHQLLSVGAGAVLRDMLKSKKIPHTELTKIHRNAGDIVKTCHRIKHGKFYQPSSKLDVKEGLNLRHVERGSKKAIARTIEKIACERMPTRGYDPIWDVQVISPVNSRTDISCDALNKILKRRLNPAADPDRRFSQKDKVIRIKNSRVQAIVDDETPPVEEYIVNGDLGTVRNANGHLDIDFLYPYRQVRLPEKDKNLLLAYCITCHRMQGSEAPVVIIPVDKSFSFFLSRPWIYTAISRAQQICITVGQFDAIRAAIERPAADERVTRLVDKINDFFGPVTGYAGEEAFSLQ